MCTLLVLFAWFGSGNDGWTWATASRVPVTSILTTTAPGRRNPPVGSAAPIESGEDVTVTKRLGVMGGTFDPIHHGHLVTAEEALCQFALDEVVLVPTGRPWMKADQEVSTAE